MFLECSAVIPDDEERQRIKELVVKRLSSSYRENKTTKTLYAVYEGRSEETITHLISTFEIYPVHSIYTQGL